MAAAVGGESDDDHSEEQEDDDEEAREYPWLKTVTDAAGCEVWKDTVRGALALRPWA